ncbi:hypothetical protein [Pelagicoccus albus]|uniref:hypothetical protein n=1 Tax=Pelagicoccus albus TaxID=415222 RepID=UPI001C8C7573|nr:hypothetical protein [Pelagicoccus albus]
MAAFLWICVCYIISIHSPSGLRASITLEAKTIQWPEKPQPPIESKSIKSEFDGILVSILSLQISDLKIHLARTYGLNVSPSSSPRYSGQMSGEFIPGVLIGLSCFEPNHFLESLSEEDWNAYKLGLEKSNPLLTITLDNSNAETLITPYVFGKTFRQIAYEIKSGGRILKRREIFSFIEGKLLVITAVGEKDDVDQNWIRVDRLISEMTLIP